MTGWTFWKLKFLIIGLKYDKFKDQIKKFKFMNLNFWLRKIFILGRFIIGIAIFYLLLNFFIYGIMKIIEIMNIKIRKIKVLIFL